MNNAWLKFCEKFKRKLDNDKILADRSAINYLTRRHTSEITFYLHYYEFGNGHMMDEKCFNLDKEDLMYLYNKYSNKLGEELLLEKKKLDDLYNFALITYTPENADKQE